MKSTIFLFPLLGAFALPAAAQLDNTVEVTNEVKPVVKDANKINVLPSVVETPVKHNKVEYASQSQPHTSFADEPLRDYSCDAAYNGNKRGYLQLAGGSHGQVDAEGAYQFDFSNHDALNIDLTLKGFNGTARDNEYYDVNDWKSRFYKSRVAGKYNHRFDNGVDFYLKGDLEDHVFNYMPSFSVFSSQTDKQHNFLTTIAAGITPYEMGDLTLSGTASLQYFGQKRPTNISETYDESILNLNGLADYMFSDEHSVELGVEFFKSGYSMDEVKGITHLHFTPHYKYNGDNVKLQLGIVGGTDGDIAPDVQFAYHVTSRSDFYINAIGYDVDNVFRRLSNIHPYFTLQIPMYEKLKVDAEFHQINASIGYRFNSNNGVSGNLNAGYDVASNVAEIDEISNIENGLQYPLVTFSNSHRFYLNADFTFAYKDKVKVDLKNQFNAWKHKGEDADEWISGSYTRPTLDLRWKADFTIVENLHAGLNWEISYYNDPDIHNASIKPYDRPITNNIGMSLRYAFPIDLPLSVFVKGDNLLNQKHDRYFGYRAIGANVIAGVAMSF